MLNPRQEHPASSKAPNKNLKDINVFCPLKIKIENQNQIMGLLNTSDNIQIKMKMPNPCQEHPASSKVSKEDSMDIDVLYIFNIKITNPYREHPASSKAPNQDLKDMDVLCTFKIKIEPQFGTWVYERPLTISK